DLLVICRSGGRSGMACGGLGDNAINVDGGMLAWEAAGLPTR
ncbi:MAG: rhodanese-like domain-containing protein, partial [Arenimonas sp.]|nr:rhodanese-like domain-containing protein [Arenimonas sp.]